MRTITLKNIHRSFGQTTVLSDVSMTLAFGKRLAVVGENGAGKSTLLKILCGGLEADTGEIFGDVGEAAYIAQDFSGTVEETPSEFLTRATTNSAGALKLLLEAGFDVGTDQKRLHAAKCADLSGGELKKLEIAAGLANNKPYLALDEPENHLDYATIEWLVKKLKAYRGGLIFISHDQYLIDSLADTIVELEKGKLTVYTMAYEEYLSEKVRHLEGLGREWEIERRDIARMHDTLEMMKIRVKKSPNTAATYRQTKRRYEELLEKHGDRPKVEPNKPKVSLGGVTRKGGKELAMIRNLYFSYGDRELFHNADADLGFGEKVVLFGKNGVGKSTLVKLILGELQPTSGSARIGNDVRYQVMTQDHLAGIDSSKSALETLCTTLEWSETRARSALIKYGLQIAAMERPLSVLSGGQQARFKLALTFGQNPEFLILDEPTNHVDPPTWEAIVEAIQNYRGTVLAITHDRAFIDAIAQKLWVIDDKRISVYLGTLSEYLAPKASTPEPEDDYEKYLLDPKS